MNVEPAGVQVPGVVARLWPVRGVPETTGAAPWTGGDAVTGSEAAETATTDPSALVAVTSMRTVAPRSAVVSV